MNALLLALLLLANPSPRDLRLEAAAFWAQPEALTQLADAIDVEHQTVALLPSPDAAQLTALLEGPLGRFVGGAVTSLEAPPAVLHLPISSAEWLPDLLPPEPDLAGLRLSADQVERGETGAQVSLGLRLTWPQQPARAQHTVFVRHELRTNLELSYAQPYAILLRSARGGDGPLVGVALHLVAPGGPLVFAGLRPPVAPPLAVQVVDPAGRAALLPWSPGLTSGAVLDALGWRWQPGSRLHQTSLDAAGGLQTRDASANPRGLLLAARDSLRLTLPPAPGRPGGGLAGGAAGPEGVGGMGGMGGPGAAARGPVGFGGPAGPAAPAPPANAFDGAPPNANMRAGAGPEAAAEAAVAESDALTTAALAVVGLRGAWAPADEPGGEVVLAATFVGPDGLAASAPAELFADLHDLRAVLADGRERPLRLLHADPVSGLALLRVVAEPDELAALPWLPLAAELPPPGTPLRLLTPAPGPPRTLTWGPPPAQAPSGLWLSAPLAQGQAGSALIDPTGALVGLAHGNITAGGGQRGHAIPAPTIATALATLDEPDGP